MIHWILLNEAIGQQQQQEDQQRYTINTAAEEREDKFDKEMFLEALRRYRCLWDTNDPSYKNRTMKVNSWKQLATMFKQEGRFFLQVFFMIPSTEIWLRSDKFELEGKIIYK